MIPYKVLAVYKPERWNAKLIGRDLTDLTAKLGYVPHDDPAHGPLRLGGKNWYSPLLHAEVRRRTFNTKQAEDWHYDGDLEPLAKPDCHIVCWASNHPTEIKWRDRKASLLLSGEQLDTIFQPKPYEVVVFDNSKCLHRRPPGCPRIRWMFRQRVQYWGRAL